MVPISLSNAIRGVKILALTHPNLNDVIGMLKCFPCVEKLHMVTISLLNLLSDISFYLTYHASKQNSCGKTQLTLWFSPSGFLFRDVHMGIQKVWNAVFHLNALIYIPRR